MRIAIIGTGISGLTCAHLLHRQHELTLFEAGEHVGGHTNTVTVRDAEGVAHRVDTGFIVCNRRTYPNFTAMLDRLGVALQPSDMSLAVRSETTGVEWNGHDIAGLFAQRRNLLSPSHHRMWWDILRFNRLSRGWLEADPALSVREALAPHGFGERFRSHYLEPMCAAIWSMPYGGLDGFPMRFLARFLDNHGMNTVNDRPLWYTVAGGSATYVEAILRPLSGRVHVRSPVRRVTRRPQGGVSVATDAGSEDFDEAIIAAHSDQALAMIAEPDAAERAVLGAIPYQPNTAVLHSDVSALPRLRRTWAAWNVRAGAAAQPAAVTYWSNRLQGLSTATPFLVSLNQAVDPQLVHGSYGYHHPLFTAAAPAAQARHGELIRNRGISCCGAYWRFGFHEDGVVSALAVCERFGVRP
ncbi:MAG: FAD-dependent oxidoreductase [Planctomycetes bacterium]|nr:FAD-dependent oxidoreductase [Planctomycetota bacterium]